MQRQCGAHSPPSCAALVYACPSVYSAGGVWLCTFLTLHGRCMKAWRSYMRVAAKRRPILRAGSAPEGSPAGASPAGTSPAGASQGDEPMAAQPQGLAARTEAHARGAHPTAKAGAPTPAMLLPSGQGPSSVEHRHQSPTAHRCKADAAGRLRAPVRRGRRWAAAQAGRMYMM